MIGLVISSSRFAFSTLTSPTLLHVTPLCRNVADVANVSIKAPARRYCSSPSRCPQAGAGPIDNQLRGAATDAILGAMMQVKLYVRIPPGLVSVGVTAILITVQRAVLPRYPRRPRRLAY